MGSSMEDIVVPVALFLAVVMIVLIAVVASVINRFNLHETVREALRQGKTLDAEAIKALGAPRKKSNNDLKSGLILIAVAVGLVALGAMMGMAAPVDARDPSPALVMAGVAAIPGLIGVVLTGFGVVNAVRPGRPED